MTQDKLHRTMSNLLRKKYSNILETKDYIVAIGDIPIALVAHLDTVFKTPVTDLYYDKQKGVLFSPQGLGADDRAGVFAILQILKTNLRPSIILTTDEELGGIGASILADTYSECPIPGLKYLIELDRRGSYDAVFYDCITEDFQEYIESFGFLRAKGSFSDISFLMSAWDKCGVNLSIGYKDEHTYVETLNISHMFATINKVKRMLMAKDIPDFTFQEEEYSRFWNMAVGTGLDFTAKCFKCGHVFSDYEVIPIKDKNGLTKFVCPDCVYEGIEWCQSCGEAFETSGEQPINLCNTCLEAIV